MQRIFKQHHQLRLASVQGLPLEVPEFFAVVVVLKVVLRLTTLLLLLRLSLNDGAFGKAHSSQGHVELAGCCC